MSTHIRAEFRKLLSVRSTYIVSIIALLLAGFFAFWGIGYKGDPQLLQAPDVLQNASMNVVAIVGVFVGITAMLLICHEYRYNTIMYTLSISNSRMKVLGAKLLTLTVFAAVVTFIAIAAAIALVLLGAHMAGHDVGVQKITILDLLWRTLAYCVGGAWLGLVLGFLSRSIVFAIVVYLMLPTTIEPLLQTFLKVNNNYLPMTSQSQILLTSPVADTFSPVASAGVFGLYLAIGLIAASVVFVRRDANS